MSALQVHIMQNENEDMFLKEPTCSPGYRSMYPGVVASATQGAHYDTLGYLVKIISSESCFHRVFMGWAS